MVISLEYIGNKLLDLSFSVNEDSVFRCKVYQWRKRVFDEFEHF